mmetsp:Transcript_65047/g.136263  ORF Transcript_65047/g.136263 Transcript_65047/m.136263 type:complete len:595 (-) Transcript_65047:39-1823(-)
MASASGSLLFEIHANSGKTASSSSGQPAGATASASAPSCSSRPSSSSRQRRRLGRLPSKCHVAALTALLVSANWVAVGAIEEGTCLSSDTDGSSCLQAQFDNSSKTSQSILDQWLGDIPRSTFFAQRFERTWSLHRHDKPLVPIDLEHVAEWLYASKEAAKAVEILPHPKNRREYRGKAGLLSRFEDAFLKGHSMVINSLHLWSEPAIRVARALFYEIGLPVDVYMYLTPPFSESYGQHCDVMDAFMVQLAGSKTWVLCEERNYRSAPSEEYKGTCQEVTLKGGDVMYVPFQMMHYVKTEDEVSAHLTINVERQYYVWASFLLAALHKKMKPDIEVTAFLEADVFTMEVERDAEQYFHELMHLNEKLARLPLSDESPDARKWLTMALGGKDLPPGYVEQVQKEMGAIVARTLEALSLEPKLKTRQLQIWGKRSPAKELLAAVAEPSTELVNWLLEVARLHSLVHFSRDRPKRVLPKADIFQSLSELRRSGKEGNPSSGGSLLNPDSQLVRKSNIKAVLRQVSPQKMQLNLNSQAFEIPTEQEDLMYFALGLFGPETSMGKPFKAADVPNGFEAGKQFLDQLVLKGALELLPTKR